MVQQIEIGENTNLVAEIIDFVISGNLLGKSAQVSPRGSVVTDLEVAKEFAWEKVYGEDEFTWADIRSDKMSEIWEVIYSDDTKYSAIDDKITGILDELSQSVFSQLNQQHRELLDDIVSDLKGCLYSRAVLGKSNKFFESIFAIYLNGGWPCGWSDEWPNGNAIYYSYLELSK